MDIERLKNLSGIRESDGIYELVGIRDENEYGYGGYTGNINTTQEIVATFDSEEAANAYVEKSKLRGQKIGRTQKKFRNNSLLAGYTDYEIREKKNDLVPHNPE